ncbi:MAG: glycosyltransferase [Desulfovibrionaceae bacterium]|nr:glycosyltransferase [Desulfovibrionaceae bacterium]
MTKTGGPKAIGRPAYRAEALREAGRLQDVRLTVGGKVRHLWGRNGPRQELDLASSAPLGALPVLLGSGLGVCLEALLAAGPVAVADRETALLEATGVRQKYASRPGVLWLDGISLDEDLKKLTAWQRENRGLPFAALAPALYQRLDPDYYQALKASLESSSRADFWSKARYPKFRSERPRVLLLDRPYFLNREIRDALARLEVPLAAVAVGQKDSARPGFIEDLLSAVLGFRPDFALTVNHFGLDREGRLAGLLDDLGLPLASWFVDNPELILHRYEDLNRPLTAIFSWDADNLPALRQRGFSKVFHLPLATDPARFRPGAGAGPGSWRARVSFVGDSMTGPVARALATADPPAGLARYPDLAREFGAGGEASVARFLAASRPKVWSAVQALPVERQLAFESLITWESTRQYRLRCVRATLGSAPLIVGDEGWFELLGRGPGWRRLPPLDYYQDLPRFYPLSEVNFNCTSLQMKGAVNQRVFDVPAAGGFLLTDRRAQLDGLFEPGREAACFASPEEVPAELERWLSDPAGRRAVASAARKRILAEHTYELRLGSLIEAMRASFA